ncbi:histidine phosphatase family protein [Lactobacillus paragasseri]
MDLLLVRHGVSEHNTSDVISGGTSNPNLSQAGVKQVEEVSKIIDNNKIDQVYASPLIRAKRTAQILTDFQKDIITDDRLKEMDFGSWEGQHAEELKVKCPDAFDDLGTINSKYTKYAKNGETFEQVADRVEEFLAEIQPYSNYKTIMVVCHGFVIRSLIARWFKLKIEDVMTVRNVSFTELHFEKDDIERPRLMTFNRTEPLYYGTKR